LNKAGELGIKMEDEGSKKRERILRILYHEIVEIVPR
jgi:hypothetical protein